MKHQKTCDNFYNNLHKSLKSELSNDNLNKITQENKNPFHIKSTSYSENTKIYKCKEHNRNFYKYCIICKEDICPQCYNNNHFIHDIIKYEDISLNDNQIQLFNQYYNNYIDIFSNLLIKIKQWQNILSETISQFEEYMKKNIIEIINKMINNYDINKISYNTIIEYRLIYSLLLDNNKEKINNQKMIKIMKSYISLRNYGNYQYIDKNENLSSISKENIILLNDSLNKGNFMQNGNNIIKFLFNNFSLFKENKNKNNIQNLGENYIKSKIEKNIERNIYKQKNLNKSTNNIFESITSRNLGKLLFDNNLSLNNSQSNKTLYRKKKAFDKNKNGEIPLDKEEIPIFSHNIPTQPLSDDLNLYNFNIESEFNKNSKTLIQKKLNNLYNNKLNKNNRYNKNNKTPENSKKNILNLKSRNDNNLLWKSQNFYSRKSKIINDNINDNDNEKEEYDYFDDINIDLDYKTENNRNSSLNKRPIIFNNNINNFNNINNINSKNNFINNYTIDKIYSERNRKSKIYQHKKFNTTLLNKSQSQTDKNNDTNTFNTIDLHNCNYDTISLNKNISISMTDNKNNSSINKDNNYKVTTGKIIIDNDNINNNWKIKKVNEFLIDANKDLNIGFELGNTECKIGIINQFSNCVELWVPYDDDKNTSIPTLISFKDKNDNIIIGNNAEELKINNPVYTIFNFIKFIGINSNEIEGKKELWAYKLYNNIKTGRPYIKGYYNGYKNKIYNFEDLLSLYLRKLFELLFNKIKFKDSSDNNNLIKINIVVSVPNHFNYFQRKVVEKIFQTQLFPKIKKNNNLSNYYYEDNINKNKVELYSFGKYNIQINNIKIENSSNIGYLYLFQKQIENNFKKINKNIILIHVEGGSINISLISTLIKNGITEKEKEKENKNEENNNKYEIKEINGLKFGEEDFTDNFVNSCLSDFTEKIKDECLKTPSALAKLRKSCEMAKKYFYKTNQTEINIEKLYKNIDLKMALNKIDYERACNDQFQEIYELIRDLLLKSKISEKQIDDIIFIGNTTNVNIIKQKISKIFKGKNNELFNKLANNKYFENDKNNNDIINEDYIVIGATLQSFNLYSDSMYKYKYTEITPISFGIEGLNKKMDFVIEKGSIIPKQVNKYVKIMKPKGECISINIYEGENEYVYKNRLISTASINIKNFQHEISKDYIEILIQFVINTNFDLNVFILDNKTFRRKFECIINIDIVQGK